MEHQQILIACIGNIFFGDDAFGVEVARALSQRCLPEEVVVIDYGIHGLDLAFALLDGYEAVILVDAVRRGGQPGTLYLIEPDSTDIKASADQSLIIESHRLNPMRVLAFAQSMGARLNRILLIGCEVTSPDLLEEMTMELSPAVQAAIPSAVEFIELLITKILDEDFDAWYPRATQGKFGSLPISGWKA
ncbi:MAG TPA: hydrogenase maturation protease [Acidobacteriota bacterium]|nr:hydrogenase maturation protease [Acidobacteriota bacterium]HND22598.1 hydrogenase maturation protease [Acidobacteriota bacterium]